MRYREASFMAGQLLYSLLTEIPAIFVLYGSSLWSGIFFITIFAVSVWNGGGYYIEVFGRKFERELEALRKELAEATAKSNSGISTPSLDHPPSDSEASSLNTSPVLSNGELAPEALPNNDLNSTKKDL